MSFQKEGKKDTATPKTLLASLKRGASMWTDRPNERRSFLLSQVRISKVSFVNELIMFLLFENLTEKGNKEGERN